MRKDMREPTSERASPERITVRQPLLEAWQALLVNRAQPYALQQADGTYRWVYETLGPPLLLAHLRGDCTLALSSTDATGRCRWLCLDADQADALPHLLSLAGALADLGLPSLVEASRRGGHVWLLLDTPAPAAVVCQIVLATLDELRAGGLPVPLLEIYPNAAAAARGALGHAVRLPLGIHRRTGRRYALFDQYGHPCAFTSTEAAVRFACCACMPASPTCLPRPSAPRDARIAWTTRYDLALSEGSGPGLYRGRVASRRSRWARSSQRLRTDLPQKCIRSPRASP
jgi:hypothetical protein